jgi:hypothetical protein
MGRPQRTRDMHGGMTLLQGTNKMAYWEKVNRWLSTFPFGAQWPLDDAGGTGIRAISKTPGLMGGMTGDYAHANAVGPSGKRVGYSDGSDVFASLLTPALVAAWTADCHGEGGQGGWYKASTPGVWSDGTAYVLSWFSSAAEGNLNYLTKAADQNVYWVNNRGGVASTFSLPNYKPAGWFHLFCTWSEVEGRTRFYVNGELLFTGPVGVWVGEINAALLISLDMVTSWPGWYDTQVLVGGREPTPEEVRSLVNGAKRIQRLTVLGDSLSGAVLDHSDWSWLAACSWRDGLTTTLNHAAAENTILNHMAGQAAAAANDRADVIVIVLGTNDGETGEALSTEYGNNLAALQASNPTAKIYGVGIPDRADMSGVAEKNARIQAACSAAGVTYKDPTGVIDPATMLSDGIVHWNALGISTFKDWVLSWLG